jgi:hypothetical protein
MDDGKIKFTIPLIPSHIKQRYVSTEVEYETLSLEQIINYCKTPRRKQDIAEHFKLTLSERRSIPKGLIESGRLRYTDESLRLCEFDGKRKLVVNEDNKED